jgi:hypothetical protein
MPRFPIVEQAARLHAGSAGEAPAPRFEAGESPAERMNPDFLAGVPPSG